MHMELLEIKKLIEKYLEAETTLAEEKQLEAYFASGNVHPEVEQYGDMFGYYKSQREVSAPVVQSVKKSSGIFRFIPAAAAAAVLIGIGVFAWQSQETQVVASEYGTYDDPEVAYRETKKALELLSGKVNTGMESVSYLNEYEQSKNAIFKN